MIDLKEIHPPKIPLKRAFKCATAKTSFEEFKSRPFKSHDPFAEICEVIKSPTTLSLILAVSFFLTVFD